MDKKRILVVEDEGVVALDIQETLEDLGYDVVGLANSGMEALELAGSGNPDLILMDIRLGSGIDGVEAARRIGEVRNIPFIYLTAFSDGATVARARETGPFGYLTKPFAERELYTSIEMALYKHAMESKLRDREQWLTTTLQSIGDGVIATRLDGSVVFMNPVAQRLTAWDEKDAMNLAITQVFHVTDPEISGAAIDPHRLVMESKQVLDLSSSAQMTARDGRKFPIEDSVAPIIGPRGEVSGAVLVFRDASQKREAEEALRLSEEKLMHAQKMESLGRLAGGIAHDFNNLLTAINGYSELVLANMSESDPIREHVVEIRKSGERAATLTHRLLAYSRKQVLQPTVLDMNSTVQGIVNLLRRLLGSKVHLDTRLQQGLEKIRVDHGQLEQVIMNLVLNARDAMPEGGTITLSTSTFVVEGHPHDVSAREPVRGGFEFIGPPGKYIVLSVADQGIGMDEATKAHIFEPFFTTKAMGRGTGLGLSMVYGYVKQSGGGITVSSSPGKGSEFRVYFPAYQGSQGK